MRAGDMLDVANFVSRGQIEMQFAIDTVRRAKTPAASYEKTYGTICAGCRGLDGGI
jgi:hypothetical protein